MLVPRRVSLIESGMAQLGIRVYLNKERGCPDWQALHLDPCQISAPVRKPEQWVKAQLVLQGVGLPW